MLGQFQAVGAGDRDVGVLERLDYRIKGIAAPPHQHQHVAIAQRPPIAGMAGHRAACDQPLDLGLDASGELYFRACHRHAVERRAPALDVLLVVGFRQFPEIDQTRPSVGQRIVNRISDIGGMDAAIDRLLAEHVIDGLQDRRPRAKRVGERHRIEFQAGILEFLPQRAAAQIEFARGRALKRKNRLLLVADREDGARDTVARAFT